jgi:hypothetical protein
MVLMKTAILAAIKPPFPPHSTSTLVPTNRRRAVYGSRLVARASPDVDLENYLLSAFAGDADIIKLGLAGCGGRGSGAAMQVLTATQTPVKLWAMTDLFADRIESTATGYCVAGK